MITAYLIYDSLTREPKDKRFGLAVAHGDLHPRKRYMKLVVSYQITNKIKISASHTCYHPIATDNGVSRGGMFGGGDVISISYGY